VLSFDVDRGALVIVPQGKTALPERQAFYDTIRRDVRVADRVCVIVDARDAAEATEEMVRERAQTMVAELAPRTIRVCAVLMAGDGEPGARAFRIGASDVGVRVGVFSDETLARQWLNAYQD